MLLQSLWKLIFATFLSKQFSFLFLLLDACVNGNGEIFKEIKKRRSFQPPVASSMDGKKENIANHFKDIYGELYNSVDDMNNMFEMKQEIEDRINF